MKSGMSSVVPLLFFELLIAIATFNISVCNGNSYVGCIETERKALLSFRGDLQDPSNRLASWIGDEDCCKWIGVVCHNFTGHVLQLQLRNNRPSYFFSDAEYEVEYEAFLKRMLDGKINPSLLDLKHLVYLDLSGNNFSANHHIPRFLNSMRNLRYLNLSFCEFEGLIPPQLGNLSHLQYLDLSSNKFYAENSFYAENLNWLSSLSLLKYLDLSSVNLTKASDWLLDINTLSHLVVLKLSSCELPRFPLLHMVNFTSLASLDLQDNNFQGPIPKVLQNLTSLRHLDLSSNYFNSSIPNWFCRSFSHLEYLSFRENSLRAVTLGCIGNLTSLQSLDLSDNFELKEKIPTSWKRLCNLKSIYLSDVNLTQELSQILDIFSECILVGLESLDLMITQLFGSLSNQLAKLKNIHTLDFSYNSISGPIPLFLGQLSSLKFLDFSYNQLNGTLSEIRFSNLSHLEEFDISENSVRLEVSRNWIPPFQLRLLGLSSCHLGPEFPTWLSSQKHLNYIGISNSRIVGRVPIWFWKSSSTFSFLNLSHNQLQGIIPNLTISSWFFDLSWNNFSGPLPLISANLSVVEVLDLSNNRFSGSVSHFFCIERKETVKIIVLNLQNNLLSGELPDCWSNRPISRILNLGNNEFTGHLPTSMGTLSSLQSLHLQRNKLSGTIPVSFKNLTYLEVFDLSDNEFIGNIPSWIGECLLWLKILNLHSNNFDGILPVELCRLQFLQILNLFDNNITGTIPRCVSNFSAMVTIDKFESNDLSFVMSQMLENAFLVIKGQGLDYSANLNLVRSIDLSANNFFREIPMELTNLAALRSLNLSHNSFSGTISESIGAMKSLESLDLSSNQLFGKIPQSFSNLSFLSYLNLSDNKLIGEIPLSTQLQGFDPSCFMGNELCGLPLKECSSEVPKSSYDNGGEDDANAHEVDWVFYVSMALGFVTGFWVVLCPLFASRRWRSTYYSFLNQLWNKFYVSVVGRCS